MRILDIIMCFETRDLEIIAVRTRISLYKQIKEQLLNELKLYRMQGKDELAKLISESM
jgi:hypothetical protein